MRFNCIILIVQCEGSKDGSVDRTRRLADILWSAWVAAGVCVWTDGATGCGLKHKH